MKKHSLTRPATPFLPPARSPARPPRLRRRCTATGVPGWYAPLLVQGRDDAQANPASTVVDRERFCIQHDQDIAGNNTELRWNTRIAQIGSSALNLEDRMELAPNFALVGGQRYNRFSVARTSRDVAGGMCAGFPLRQKWAPLTGRIGFTWDTAPNVSVYGQYATVSVSDIQRSNVYSAQAGQRMNAAGQLDGRGVDITAALRPFAGLNLWGNAAYVHARHDSYELTGRSFSGHTPPNIPSVILNGGGSCRLRTVLPVELGASFSRVGERFTTDENSVTMQGYATSDLFAFVNLPRGPFTGAGDTRFTLRVKNVGNPRYAAYGEPFYPDQVFLGAPRTVEASVSFKF